MANFDLDYNFLSQTVEKKHYKLSEVKDRLVKVAFDVFRIKGNDPEELWQVQSADDGDYIVARYNDVAEEIKTTATDCKTTETDWKTVVASEHLNVFYKGHPIMKLAAKQLGLSSDQLNYVQEFLPAKLAEDKDFVHKMLNELDNSKRSEILKLYPELK
jgi:hypothetical protein